MTILLSKVLNCRCQGRKYGAVAEKQLFPTPSETQRYERLVADPGDPVGRRFVQSYQRYHVHQFQFQQVVLCGLLGGYEHCDPASRPDGPTRDRLYELMHAQSHAARVWMQSLLHGCPALVVWCVRDYLVHALRDNPALLSQVGELMLFDRFQVLVGQAMSTVRRYVQQNLPHAWSVMSQHAPPSQLCRCMDDPPNTPKGQPKPPRTPCMHEGVRWFDEVTTLLLPYHQALLDNAYRKPDSGILSFLVGKEVRTRAPLVPI
jgi:hypothetical protein